MFVVKKHKGMNKWGIRNRQQRGSGVKQDLKSKEANRERRQICPTKIWWIKEKTKQKQMSSKNNTENECTLHFFSFFVPFFFLPQKIWICKLLWWTPGALCSRLKTLLGYTVAYSLLAPFHSWKAINSPVPKQSGQVLKIHTAISEKGIQMKPCGYKQLL